MYWWSNSEKIALLVSVAEEMADRYAHQPIAGIGHSPSWLTHAIGQVRANRGEERNVVHIPFSGSASKHVSFASSEADESIKESVFEYAEGKSPALNRISNYFNSLNETQRRMLGLGQEAPAANGKTVLIDFVEKGNSFADFANVLARHTGQPDLSAKFDAHVFKQFFHDQTVQIAVENPDAPTSVLKTQVQSGEAARLLNDTSGAQGAWAPEKPLYGEKFCGRFMPIFNIHSNDRPQAPKLENAVQVKEIKQAIAEMIASADTKEGREFMRVSREKSLKSVPKPVAEWLSGIFPHGGNIFGMQSPRQQPQPRKCQYA